MSDGWLPRGKTPFKPEPKPISNAQWEYLRTLLDCATDDTILTWLSFANGYPAGGKPASGWSSIHASRAISMLKYGSSDEYHYSYLEALSFGLDVQPEDFPSPDTVPLWVRRKIAVRKRQPPTPASGPVVF